MKSEHLWMYSATKKTLLLNNMLCGIPEEIFRQMQTEFEINIPINLNRYYFCLTGISHSALQRALAITDYSYFWGYYKPRCIKIQEELSLAGYDSVFFIPVFYTDPRICFMLSVKDAQHTYPIQDAGALIHKQICELYQEMDVPSNIYNYTIFSDKFFGYSSIPMVYQKLNLLCDSMFFFPQNTVLGSSQFEKRPNTLTFDMTRSIGKLESALLDGDTKSISVLLESIIWDNLCPIRCKNMLKTFVTILTEKINRILYVYNLEQSVKESLLYPENFNNIQDFYNTLHQMVLSIAEILSKCKRPMPMFLYETLLYIKEHIREDIFLTDIADFIYISPSHLSRSFKNHMGMGLPAYILKERMKIAASLLCETSMSNTAIASEVGIHSNSYFTKLFCKEYKVPPQEFRKLYANKIDRHQM